MGKKIAVSALPKTWILDLDGTIVKHNGFKEDGADTFLDGAEQFLSGIAEDDMVVFLTSRTDRQKGLTEAFLDAHHIRHDAIIYNVPYGERILINDRKPSGLRTAIAVNTQRDVFLKEIFEVDGDL